MDAKRKAAIYRKAAALLERGARHSGEDNVKVTFSCCAIAEAEGIFPLWDHDKKRSLLADRYQDIFDGNFGWDKGHRVTALCMMAAMVERP